MGSLREDVKQAYVARFGEDMWRQHLKSIDDVWSAIRQILSVLKLSYDAVRLYQDGLPVCGKEFEIVQDVAVKGSINHQLLLELIAQGAQLEGTEDPSLLMEEYRLHQDPLKRTQLNAEKTEVESSEKLLMRRDKFIAGRINSTLRMGEVGLLFLGLAHSIDSFLDEDILVRHLLPSMREKQGFARA